MLRNYLITLLAEKDNDTVTVNVSGILVDIDGVTVDRGCIVLDLNPEDVQNVVHQMVSGMPAERTTPGG